MAYPVDFDPVYSHNAVTGTGAGTAIDISVAKIAGYPPVMIVTFTGTATYTIQGSHDGTNWHNFTASLTASVAKNLIPGIRFWRTNIAANSATFTSSVGPVPSVDGTFLRPNIATTFASPSF